MLTSEKYIISVKGNPSKKEVFQTIAQNLISQGIEIEINEVVSKLQEREEQVSTGFEKGIAIPHAKIAGLTEPIITIVKTEGIDWNSMDGENTDLILNILVPENGSDQHLKILAQLTRKLINDDFIKQLKNATNTELVEIINSIKIDEEKESVNKKENGKKFVAITSCPMGVAHTYMAAESLEKYGLEKGYTYKVETQGTIGVENELSQKEIQEADFVIIAADRKVELDRFIGKKMIEVSTKDAINKVEQVFELEKKATILKGEKSESVSLGGGQNEIMKALMNGVSHMLPLVVVGGLFLGLSLAFGGVAGPDGLVIPEDSFWSSIQNIGMLGFGLMIPILSGYIAYSIGDRSALAPGLIIGMIANDGSFYNSEASAGFLGAIVGGIMVGYFVKYFTKIKIPKNFQSVMPIIVIPLVTTFITSVVFIYVIGYPIAYAFTALSTWLGALPTSQMVLIGALLGFMIAIDMGGPINKTAMLFAMGMISAGQPEFMGINGVAVATPSIGIGLATMLRPKYYNEDERGAGMASAMMGCVGITEGAIPFAASHPKEVFPANIIGAMVGGMIAAFFAITNVVPHGGIIIAFTGGVNKPLAFIIAIIIGAIVTALIANFLMSKKYKKIKNK